MRYLVEKIKGAYYHMSIAKKLVVVYIVTFIVPLALLMSIFFYSVDRSIDRQYTVFAQKVQVTQEQNYQEKIRQVSSLRSFLTSNKTFTDYLQGWYLTTSDRVTMYNGTVKPLITYMLATNSLVRDIQIYPLKEIHIPPNYFYGTWNSPHLPLEKIVDMYFQDAWFCDISENGDVKITYYTCLYNADYSQQLAILILDLDPWQILDTTTSDVSEVYYQYNDCLYHLLENGKLIPAEKNQPPETVHEGFFPWNSIGYYVCQGYMEELGVSFYSKLDFSGFSFADQMMFAFFLLALLSLLTSVVFVTMVSGTKRITRFSRHLEQMDDENLRPIKLDNYYDEIGILFQTYNGMIEKIDRLIREVYLAEMSVMNARYYALLSQINTHFLMNTLENIRMTALMNADEQASEMLYQLGSVMSYALKQDDLTTTIAQELEHARNMLKLYAVRIGKSFSYSIDIPMRYRQLSCPKFVLQPIIENAVIHAFVGIQGEKKLTIRAGEDESGIYIEIRDNGNGIAAERLEQMLDMLSGKSPEKEENTDRQSIGLSNVNQRLQMFYKEKQGIIVWNDGGAVFQLRMGTR